MNEFLPISVFPSDYSNVTREEKKGRKRKNAKKTFDLSEASLREQLCAQHHNERKREREREKEKERGRESGGQRTILGRHIERFDKHMFLARL
jgi:hypothetical protein